MTPMARQRFRSSLRRRPLRSVLSTLAILLLVESSGCMLIQKHYVDHQTHGSYQAIQDTGAPRLVKIDVEHQRNGRHAWFLKSNIEPHVIRVLTSTRAFVVADSTNEAQAGHLRVVLDEQFTAGELAAAAGKGALGGLTYGAIMPEVASRYEVRIAYTPPGGATQTWSYQSVHRCKFGLDAMLSEKEAVPLSDVTSRILEGPLVDFVCDYQGWERNTTAAMYAAGAAPTSYPSVAINPLPATHVAPGATTGAAGPSNAPYAGLQFR
jgi:hypothetical protein